MEREYTHINSDVIDKWVDGGWIWSRAIDHETFEKAKAGDWSVLLTPTKPVPREWFCDLNGAMVLGLASGGGQQMPVFTALGAKCTVLDYSKKQLDQERMVAHREGYEIEIVRADMTKPLPFPDACFDLIFHPVSNCYIEDVLPVWRECHRVLKRGGILLAGLDNGLAFAFDDEGDRLVRGLPFNALKDPALYEFSIKNDWGIQFSHTIEEQVGGQIQAGLVLTNIFEDSFGSGRLQEFNIPCFFATRAVKP
jgi:SAM-dependent methyltransferase